MNMREPSATSPFAARTPQELHHQWTVWQAQQDVTRPVDKQVQSQKEPETMPHEETPMPSRQLSGAPVQFIPRHAQYDSILKRMKTAGQQAGDYVTVGTGSTTQPLSGSEKPEK